MKDQQLLERIILNPNIMVGKPVIKGTRLTVEYILNLLAHGETIAEILEEYTELTVEDVQVFAFRYKILRKHCLHASGNGNNINAFSCG